MAGIMVGRHDAEAYPLHGIAPNATLFPVRISTYVSDSHANRMAVAIALLEAVFAQKDNNIRVVLLGPVFERPQEDYEATYGKGLVDPLILAILIAQSSALIVLPAGNNGSETELSYPSDPADYGRVVNALAKDSTSAIDMLIGALDDTRKGRDIEKLKSGILKFFETNSWTKNAIAQAKALIAPAPATTAQDKSCDTSAKDETSQTPNGLSLAAYAMNRSSLGPDMNDPFQGSGIINVGAAQFKTDGSGVEKAGYSQSGWGVTLLAPSGTDYSPSAPCTSSQQDWHGGIPTADIFGHGGYSADPTSKTSDYVHSIGFGGTSAASAIIAGLAARAAETMSTLDGPSLCEKVLSVALPMSRRTAYSKDLGHGILHSSDGIKDAN